MKMQQLCMILGCAACVLSTMNTEGMPEEPQTIEATASTVGAIAGEHKSDDMEPPNAEASSTEYQTPNTDTLVSAASDEEDCVSTIASSEIEASTGIVNPSEEPLRIYP